MKFSIKYFGFIGIYNCAGSLLLKEEVFIFIQFSFIWQIESTAQTVSWLIHSPMQHTILFPCLFVIIVSTRLLTLKRDQLFPSRIHIKRDQPFSFQNSYTAILIEISITHRSIIVRQGKSYWEPFSVLIYYFLSFVIVCLHLRGNGT